jgi:hypothetical protein
MDDVHTADHLAPWQEGDGMAGVLSRPFPLRGPWNDLAGMPDEGLSDANEDEFLRQMDAFDQRYFDASRLDGAMPLCHVGCALRVWLVVTGPEAGFLWHDGRADYTGLRPLTLRNSERATFASWYGEWLVDALQAPPGPPPPSAASKQLARAKRWLRRWV